MHLPVCTPSVHAEHLLHALQASPSEGLASQLDNCIHTPADRTKWRTLEALEMGPCSKVVDVRGASGPYPEMGSCSEVAGTRLITMLSFILFLGIKILPVRGFCYMLIIAMNIIKIGRL